MLCFKNIEININILNNKFIINYLFKCLLISEVWSQPWQTLHALQAQAVLRALSVPLPVNAPLEIAVHISWTWTSIWHFSTLQLIQEVFRQTKPLKRWLQKVRQLTMHISLVSITLEKIACQAPMEQTLRAITILQLLLEWSLLQLTHQVRSLMCVTHFLFRII